jgi:autotransporter translocation and assembly factor TamB
VIFLSRKRILLLVSLLLLVVVVSTGTFYLTRERGLIAERARLFAEKELSLVSHQSVQIRTAHLALFPTSVVFTDITSSGPTPFSAKEVQVYFRFWSFLSRSLFVRKVIVESPTLSMGDDSFIAEWLSGGATPPRRIRVQIHHGEFFYKGANKELFLPDLDINLAPHGLIDRFDIAFSGEGGHLLLAQRKKQVARFDGKLVTHPGRINLTSIRVRLDKTDFKMAGVVTLPKDKESIDGMGLQLTLKTDVPIEEYLSAPNNRQTFSGNLMLQGNIEGTVSDPLLTGMAALPKLTMSGGEGAAAPREIGSLKAHFVYKNKTVSLNGLSGNLFSGEIAGKSRLTLSGPPISLNDYQIDLQYNHVAIDKIETMMTGNEEPLLKDLLLKGDFRLSGRDAALETISVEGKTVLYREPGEATIQPAAFSSKAGTVGRMGQFIALLKTGQADWKWDKKSLLLKEGSFAFDNGTGTFDGTIHLEKGIAVHVELDGNEIEEAARIIYLPIGGRLHAAGDFSGSLGQPFFKGHLSLPDWQLMRRHFGPLQTEFLYQNKTFLFRNGSVQGLSQLRLKNAATKIESRFDPCGSAGAVRSFSDCPVYQFGGVFRFANGPAYHILSNVTSVDPQEILRLFNSVTLPLTTTVTGELQIDGKGKRVVVTGPLLVGAGSLYREPFENGKMKLTVTEKEARIRNLVLERQGATAEGEGDISYQGEYRLDMKTTALQIPEIDLIRSRFPEFSGEIILTASGKGSFRNPDLKLFGLVQKLRYRDVSLESGTIQIDWKGDKIQVESAFPEKKFSLRGQVTTPTPYPFSFEGRFAQIPIHSLFEKQASSTPVGEAPLPPNKMGRAAALSSAISALQKSQPTGKASALYASGSVSGDGTFTKVEEINLTATLTDFSAHWGGYVLANDGPIVFQSQKGVFQIEKASLKNANTQLTLLGGVTPFKSWGLAIKGTADLDLLRLFMPTIRSSRGMAHLDLRIINRWKEPDIQGSLSLSEGRVSFANKLPILITSLSLIFNRRLILLESVSGKIGPGRFTGFGKVAIAEWRLSRFGFQFDLSGVPIAVMPDLTAVVDGPLFLSGDSDSQLIEGTLHIRKAVYEKRIDLGQTVIAWLTREPEPLPADAPFLSGARLNLHLYGKEDIAVRNNVAHVSLAVDLDLKGSLSTPLLFGQVDIPKGTFYFQTNEFKVTSGTVQFVHPTKIDPSFDIRGQSRVRNYIVDLTLTGQLSQFNLSLNSLPPLPDPETDILLLLTIGKTTAEVAGVRDEAATFIASDMISSYLAEPAEGIGFDRIWVGASSSKSSNNTMISFEKKLLSDKLLLIYSKAVDLSEEQRIQLFYDLGKNVSLVGERDEQDRIGGDIRFRFEFR